MRMLRKQAKMNNDYRTLIAKQEAEILVRFLDFYLIENKKKKGILLFRSFVNN